MTAFQSLSGYEVRVLHGSSPIGGSLSLAFDNLLEGDLKAVTDHFAACRGSYDLFDLPVTAWAGLASYAHITPAGFKWRYQAAPQVTYVAPGVGNVSLTLLAVPA
jgi:hypothetical protein